MQNIDTALILRLEATLSKFDKQMASARRTADTTATSIQRKFDDTNRKMTATSLGMAGALNRVVNISGRGRFVLQNTANQIGDIAVQLQGGAGASRALGQQLPQLLGGFGALGGTLGLLGPLLGTVAAIGIPVAAMLLRNRDSAEEAEEAMKSFADRLSEAQGALSRAESAMAQASIGGLADLEKKYGEVTEKVIRLAQELYKIEERAALVSVGSLIDDAFGAEFEAEVEKLSGVVGKALVAGTEEEAEQIRRMIADLNAEIGLMQMANQAVPQGMFDQRRELEEELAAVEGRFTDIGALAAELTVSPEFLQQLQEARTRLDAAREAGDFSAMADTFSTIHELLVASGAEIEQGVLNAIAQAESETRVMANVLNQAKVNAEGLADSGGKIGPALQGGISAAQALANNLGIALSRAIELSRNTPMMTDEDAAMSVPVIPDGRQREVNRRAVDSMTTATSSGGGGGGGGGGGTSEIDQMSAAYERLRGQLDPAYAAMQKLGEAQNTLNWALETGVISLPEYERLMARANEQMGEGAQAAEAWAQEVGAFFGDVLVDMFRAVREGENAWSALKNAAMDALDSIMEQALRMAANAAIQMILGSAFGVPMGGGFGMGFGMPSFDGGGYTGSGARSGGVDGKGGFPAILHPRETVIDHTRGGAGGAKVEINISGNLPEGTVRQRQGRIDIDLGRAVAQVIDSGAANGAMRRQFGLAPRGSGA